jgi:hypothetical protein
VDSKIKVDPIALTIIGALGVTAVGLAAAAVLRSREETHDELVDRLVEGARRRGDAGRPWYVAAAERRGVGEGDGLWGWGEAVRRADR